MSKSDKQANIILVFAILVYLAVLVTGLLMHDTANYFSFLNAATAFGIIIYWIQKQIRITQHIFEAREISVLCLEGLIAGISVYTILSGEVNYWFKILQYVTFGVHLTLLILFLIFMLTFKIKKLF